MEKILSNINVSSTRIEAIDGKYTDLQSLPLLNPQFKITNYLLAGGLSHVKAINYLKNIDPRCSIHFHIFILAYIHISIFSY
jgi:hypothetical protein